MKSRGLNESDNIIKDNKTSTFINEIFDGTKKFSINSSLVPFTVVFQ